MAERYRRHPASFNGLHFSPSASLTQTPSVISCTKPFSIWDTYALLTPLRSWSARMDRPAASRARFSLRPRAVGVLGRGIIYL
jgi:hypothetical protein